MVGIEVFLYYAQGDEDPLHPKADLTHLVGELRRKVELDLEEPQLLQTVHRVGYRLVTEDLLSKNFPV